MYKGSKARCKACGKRGYQSGLTMVDVGDDRDVAQVVALSESHQPILEGAVSGALISPLNGN